MPQIGCIVASGRGPCKGASASRAGRRLPGRCGRGTMAEGIHRLIAGSLPMPRNVLIVDDERDTREILASLVQARGFEPVQLDSGGSVPEAVVEYKPDLILLDLMLPDVDG